MTRIKRDPLLAIAQVIIALGIVLMIFVAAMTLIGLGVLLTVRRAEIMAEIAAAGAPASVYWAVAVVLALLIGLFLAVMRFLLELSGIVKSVERGDPFEPENADRLSRMGWIAVAGYSTAIVIGSIAAWIKSVAGEAGNYIDVDDVGLDGGGVLLILVLFILARVFRHGAAMREDLAGTV